MKIPHLPSDVCPFPCYFCLCPPSPLSPPLPYNIPPFSYPNSSACFSPPPLTFSSSLYCVFWVHEATQIGNRNHIMCFCKISCRKELCSLLRCLCMQNSFCLHISVPPFGSPSFRFFDPMEGILWLLDIWLWSLSITCLF